MTHDTSHHQSVTNSKAAVFTPAQPHFDRALELLRLRYQPLPPPSQRKASIAGIKGGLS